MFDLIFNSFWVLICNCVCWSANTGCEDATHTQTHAPCPPQLAQLVSTNGVKGWIAATHWLHHPLQDEVHAWNIAVIHQWSLKMILKEARVQLCERHKLRHDVLWHWNFPCGARNARDANPRLKSWTLPAFRRLFFPPACWCHEPANRSLLVGSTSPLQSVTFLNAL